MAVKENFKTSVIDQVKTLEGARKTEISRALFQKGFVGNDIAKRHLLMTDVATGDPAIVIKDQVNYASFPFLDQKSCESNECDLDVLTSSKIWALGLYNCKVGICMRDFDKDFLAFWNQNYQVLHNSGIDQDSALLLFLTNQFTKNLTGTAWRVSYFADSTLASGDDNYTLLRGGFDGFFNRAEAGAGVKFTFNQTNPTGEEAYDALEQAYQSFMDSDWSDREDVVFKMTKKFASLLVRWLNGLKDRSQYMCECFDPETLVAKRTFTIDGLQIFGIPIEVEPDLDGVIKQLSLTRPYRALLTYKTNLQVGTQLTEDIARFDIWYSKDTKKIYLEGEAYLGSMMPLDEYVYIGAEVASV